MLGHRSTLGRGAFAALVLALTLAGCGRKGALEPPPGAPLTSAPTSASAANRPVSAQDPSNPDYQEPADPGLIQSPNTTYERSAIAKLNAASTAPPPRPINAPPAPGPSTFLLDPLVK